jgi:hypothetical protein
MIFPYGKKKTKNDKRNKPMLETSILLTCRFKSEENRDLVANWLTRENRPDFEDEVPEEQQYIFLAIEDLEYPEIITKLPGSGLEIYYERPGMDDEDEIEEEITEIFEQLTETGAYDCYGGLFGDGEPFAVYHYLDGELNDYYLEEGDYSISKQEVGAAVIEELKKFLDAED